MIDLIGLDVALVLLVEDPGWKVAARATCLRAPERRSGREFSLTVLDRVKGEQRTFYQDLRQLNPSESLLHVNAVVASPILGLQDPGTGAAGRVGPAPSPDCPGVG
jgi:hypothetical protein